MDPNEVQNVLLPIVDRMIAPIVQRLDQMDDRQRQDTRQLHEKLDGFISVAQKVHTHENEMTDVKSRLADVEKGQTEHAATMNTMAGRNQVIMWLMGGLGGPITLALMLAGIAKLFNINLGS